MQLSCGQREAAGAKYARGRDLRRLAVWSARLCSGENMPSKGARQSKLLASVLLGIIVAVGASAVPIAAEPQRPHVLLVDARAVAVLPPIGFSRFCLRYVGDCEAHGMDFRRRNIVLTPERWHGLNEVNREVNREIIAAVGAGNGVTQEWLISPAAGDCKAYAVTKRHELLARGWPSRALLLSEVVARSGEHHLVLVVRVKDGDLVLDNLNDDIRLLAMMYDQYLWVRVQSPQNPKFWVRVLGILQAVTVSD